LKEFFSINFSLLTDYKSNTEVCANMSIFCELQVNICLNASNRFIFAVLLLSLAGICS